MRMFGFDFAKVTLKQAAELLLHEKRKGLVVTPNVDHIQKIYRHPEIRPLYDSALYTFADGIPLVWLSRLLGDALPERVTGSGLLPEVCLVATSQRIFLLGGAWNAAQTAARNLKHRNPVLNIGTYYPPFGFDTNAEETEKAIAEVNAFSPDILFIGVGCPKQEIWATKHLHRLNVGPVICCGQSIDFAAGFIRRAPKIVQQINLEWAWRLLYEPRRLWHRYLLEYPVFVKLAMREYRHRSVMSHNAIERCE